MDTANDLLPAKLIKKACTIESNQSRYVVLITFLRKHWRGVEKTKILFIEEEKTKSL